MTITRSTSFFVLLLALLASFSLFAADQAIGPLKLVEITVNDVVAEMNAHEADYSQDQEKLKAMVLERVAPHFSFKRMTQLAMAQHWKTATPAQREQISDEMLQLMVRTYANSMFTFRNAPINLLGEKQTSPRTAMVRLSVTNTDTSQPVDVILRMENREGRWQVIDVVVGGVSMVITYRGTFAEEISKTGIDGLIASIKQDNLKQNNAQAQP